MAAQPSKPGRRLSPWGRVLVAGVASGTLLLLGGPAVLAAYASGSPNPADWRSLSLQRAQGRLSHCLAQERLAAVLGCPDQAPPPPSPIVRRILVQEVDEPTPSPLPTPVLRRPSPAATTPPPVRRSPFPSPKPPRPKLTPPPGDSGPGDR